MDNCKHFAKFLGEQFKQPNNRYLRPNSFQPVKKRSRGAEKIFPFRGKNRRTVISVEPERSAKSYVGGWHSLALRTEQPIALAYQR